LCIVRLALFHEGAAALAEIFTVHAVGADLLDRVHVAIGGILQHLCDRDLGGPDRQRRVTGNGAGDFHRRLPQLCVGNDAIHQSDADGFGRVNPHAREHQKPGPGRPDQRHQMF
jgi:hypothetical protein